jgi:hypothetical protein
MEKGIKSTGRSFGPQPFSPERLRPMALRGDPIGRAGHHVGDGGGDPVGIGRQLELGEGMGMASDMERRVVAYPARQLKGEVVENGGAVESFDGGWPAAVAGDRGRDPAARGQGGGEVHPRKRGCDARGGQIIE